MNKDIRIAISFKGHRKRKRLWRLIGDKSDSYLVDLWLTVAMDCPNGVLVGWDEIDIADASGWGGDPNIIAKAFVDSNWLEKNADNDYVVHDWLEHNGYASDSENRSNKSRLSRMAKTYPKLYVKLRENGYVGISSSEYKKVINGVITEINGVNEALTNRLSPSPSPSAKSIHQKDLLEINSLYKTRAGAHVDEISKCPACGNKISCEDFQCPNCGEVLEAQLDEF